MSNSQNIFIANIQAIQNEFVWLSMIQAKKLAALFYALDGKAIDVAAIKNSFRGNTSDIIKWRLTQI